MMALVVGVLLAIAVGVFATRSGLDRDRAFYPVITIVIAFYYVLFGVMGSSSRALLLEMLVALIFIVGAVSGFKRSLWVVVAALAAHGLFDFFHADIISNPGVPAFWPAFCAAYDVTAAAYLAWLLKSGSRPAQ